MSNSSTAGREYAAEFARLSATLEFIREKIGDAKAAQGAIVSRHEARFTKVEDRVTALEERLSSTAHAVEIAHLRDVSKFKLALFAVATGSAGGGIVATALKLLT